MKLQKRGLKMTPQMMKAFTEWARSINVIKIRLAGYYQSFVKDFSKVATSLTNLLRKTIKLE